MLEIPFPWKPTGLGPASTIAVKGILGTGIECRTITTDAKEVFSLLHVPSEFNDGDRVELVGVIVDRSYCMVGKTIWVQSIQEAVAATFASVKDDDVQGGVAPVWKILSLRVRPTIASAKYVIDVIGETLTPGFEDPILIPLPQLDDGIQVFGFFARPPSGAVAQLTSPIAVQTVWEAREPIVGIRIHSATNSMTWTGTALFGGGDAWPWSDGRPWPWSNGRPGNQTSVTGQPGIWPVWPIPVASPAQPVSDLYGMRLRVLKPGAPGTDDFDPNRVTIRVDSNSLIIDIRVG